jgi:hypothetical protein
MHDKKCKETYQIRKSGRREFERIQEDVLIRNSGN